MDTTLTLTDTVGVDGTRGIRAAGEIDMSNVATFSAAIDEVVAQADNTVVAIDLAAVTYLDSAAINALFNHADQIRLIANPLLTAILTISGLADLIVVDTHTRGGTA